jgi:hypothetical protein
MPYAYAACSPNGIEIINVSDPENPLFVGEYDSLLTSRIAVKDDYAYLTGWRGLYLMDIRDPAAPILVASYTPSGGSEVYLQGEYIYDAAYTHFQILTLTETGLEEVGTVYPNSFSLSPAYPNPFNSSTTISYDLPQQSDVVIAIYDLLGRKVETLIAGWQSAGSHSVVWDAKDASSGVYFYHIEAGDYEQTRKCVLLR